MPRFSTVRPVKKVDAAGSQRLSNDFIETASVRQYPDGGPEVRKIDYASPQKPGPKMSERGRAGQALVGEVVLGVLDTVRRKLVITLAGLVVSC